VFKLETPLPTSRRWSEA